MRSYIFTQHERRLIQKFVSGEVTVKDISLKHLRSRVRRFTRLSEDVNLYLRLREAVAT